MGVMSSAQDSARVVRIERQGDVAVVTIDNPPVNSLGAAVRRALMDALHAVKASGARAMVLTGAGKVFSAGADIREFDRGLDPDVPDPNDVHAAIEALGIPVVAAIRGVALGGGLELALACHARVAERGARLGLPEVTLGVIPGAGGTQRLGRLVPAALAAKMIATGEPIDAATACWNGLVDRLAEGDPVAEAVAFARSLVANPIHATSTKPMREDVRAAVEQQKATLNRRSAQTQAAEQGLAMLVAAATVPFAEGLRRERDAFTALMRSETSRALRYLFFAERAAGEVAGVDRSTPVRTISSVGVVGAGTMGSGIAMVFANAGLPVTIVEKDAEALGRGLARIRDVYGRARQKGTIGEDELERRQKLISGETDLQALRGADLIIEAVFENHDVKAQVFTALDRIARPGAILATNTSALDVNAIAAVTERPQDVVGLHFFSPAHVMRLLEIVRGARTDPGVLATVMRLAKTIGKTAVVVGVCDGFCANRMLYPYLRQVDFLMEEGALPQDIDRVLTEFGLAMGPCAMLDMAGQDVAWAVRQNQLRRWPANMRYSRLSDMLYERGRLGSKSGAGWYRYKSGARGGEPDPEVEAMIRAESERLGIVRRTIGDEEILTRCLYALVNEGARIVAEGIVERPSDIDLCYVHGMGFPAARGGPMWWADSVGLDRIYREICALEQKYDANWTPAPLLAELARSGRRFADLNESSRRRSRA
jgi:3-hydroxyacyl-CoA dehydrogenase